MKKIIIEEKGEQVFTFDADCIAVKTMKDNFGITNCTIEAACFPEDNEPEVNQDGRQLEGPA